MRSHRRFHTARVFAVGRYFSTSLSNHIMGSDIVERKTQTAKIDSKVMNKQHLDWLAMEYEGQTCPKPISCFVDERILLRFQLQPGPVDHLNGKSHSESKFLTKGRKKKARFHLKSHTVMVMKKKGLLILGTDLWHSKQCSYPTPDFAELRTLFADRAWLSV